METKVTIGKKEKEREKQNVIKEEKKDSKEREKGRSNKQ